MKRFITIIPIFIMLIIVRILLNNDENIDYIIAIINISALLVIYVDVIDSNIKFIFSQNKTYPDEIVLREVKNFRKKSICLGVVLFSSFSSLYIIFLVSNLGNDIISIITIGLSLLESGIIEFVNKIIMRWYWWIW